MVSVMIKRSVQLLARAASGYQRFRFDDLIFPADCNRAQEMKLKEQSQPRRRHCRAGSRDLTSFLSAGVYDFVLGFELP